MRSPRIVQLVAWGGAALFAASMGWFFYCYFVRFGAPVGGGPTVRPFVDDLLLFGVFALHHSVLARPAVKARLARFVPRVLERSLYTWTASVLFILVCAWWRPIPGVLYELRGMWAALGYVVQAAGVALTLRAARAVDFLDLAGVRQVQEGSNVKSAEPASLQITGLYGFVRHPLYFAWLLIVFGTPVMTDTRAAFAVISSAYLAMAIPWEERDLVRTFGKEYSEYRQRVRWRMIPWLY